MLSLVPHPRRRDDMNATAYKLLTRNEIRGGR